MARCSALTVDGHENSSITRSLGNPEKALVTLSIITLTNAPLEPALKNALNNGITEDEIQDVVNSAWDAGYQDRAIELSKLVDQYRGFNLPDTRIVKLADHSTLVRDTGGAGVPIILLHALSMDASMWRAVYPHLESRAIMYDIRGFGFARDAPSTFSMDQLADDLKAVLNELNIEKADVCGTSYGGGVAQNFAVRYPGYVRSLAVLASAPKGSPILLERATNAEKFGMEFLVAPSVSRWFLPDTVAQNAWAVRYARTCVRRIKVENWAAAWRTMANLDVVAGLPSLNIPVLALAGTQDTSSPPPFLKAISGAVPNGKYVELDPGTHMMVLERPEAVVETLKKFRREIDGA